MGFLAPWFLAGALAVGLPVFVHLLRRQTTEPRPVSSLMWLVPTAPGLVASESWY